MKKENAAEEKEKYDLSQRNNSKNSYNQCKNSSSKAESPNQTIEFIDRENQYSLSIEPKTCLYEEDFKPDYTKKEGIYTQIIDYCGYNAYAINSYVTCAIVQLLSGYQNCFLGILLVSYKQYAQLNILDIIFLQALNSISTGLGSCSVPSQKYLINNRVQLLKINFTISMISSFLFSFFTNTIVLCFFRFITGFTLGFCKSIHINILNETLPSRGKKLLFVSTFSFGSISNLILLLFTFLMIKNGISVNIFPLLIIQNMFYFILTIIYLTILQNSPYNNFLNRKLKLGLKGLYEITNSKRISFTKILIKSILFEVYHPLLAHKIRKIKSLKNENNNLDYEINDPCTINMISIHLTGKELVNSEVYNNDNYNNICYNTVNTRDSNTMLNINDKECNNNYNSLELISFYQTNLQKMKQMKRISTTKKKNANYEYNRINPLLGCNYNIIFDSIYSKLYLDDPEVLELKRNTNNNYSLENQNIIQIMREYRYKETNQDVINKNIEELRKPVSFFELFFRRNEYNSSKFDKKYLIPAMIMISTVSVMNFTYVGLASIQNLITLRTAESRHVESINKEDYTISFLNQIKYLAIMNFSPILTPMLAVLISHYKAIKPFHVIKISIFAIIIFIILIIVDPYNTNIYYNLTAGMIIFVKSTIFLLNSSSIDGEMVDMNAGNVILLICTVNMVSQIMSLSFSWFLNIALILYASLLSIVLALLLFFPSPNSKEISILD